MFELVQSVFLLMFHPETLATTVLLKQHTARTHEELEQILLPRIEGVDSIESYHSLLKIFYGFFKPLEEKVLIFVDDKILPDINHRRKTQLILQDLQINTSRQLPISSDLPRITNSMQALGALYVMEGSTLGGRGITKIILKNNNFLNPSGIVFFNGYGAETGKMWTAFQMAINSISGDEAIQQMLDAANDTFLKFKNWIQSTI